MDNPIFWNPISEKVVKYYLNSYAEYKEGGKTNVLV